MLCIKAGIYSEIQYGSVALVQNASLLRVGVLVCPFHCQCFCNTVPKTVFFVFPENEDCPLVSITANFVGSACSFLISHLHMLMWLSLCVLLLMVKTLLNIFTRMRNYRHRVFKLSYPEKQLGLSCSWLLYNI